MSCRHDLALGTCARCYPDNPDKRQQIDPGPEEDHETNLEGPGAVTLEEFQSTHVMATVKLVDRDAAPGGTSGLYRERLARGARQRDLDTFLKRRAAKVLKAETWLRELSEFFKDGEVRENMLVILAELELLRSDCKRLEEKLATERRG